jgi:hypothetical protein
VASDSIELSALSEYKNEVSDAIRYGKFST